MSNVELYEALKGPVGEKAAMMIAEVVPPARELATKADVAGIVHEGIANVRLEIGQVRDQVADVRGQVADLKGQLAEVKGQIHSSARDTMRWMLAFFIPVWAGTWATVVAVILKG